MSGPRLWQLLCMMISINSQSLAWSFRFPCFFFRHFPMPIAMATNNIDAVEIPIMPGLSVLLPITHIPNQHTKFGDNKKGKSLRDWRFYFFGFWIRYMYISSPILDSIYQYIDMIPMISICLILYLIFYIN